MSARARVEELLRGNPEWRPWLAVVGAVVDALEDPAWNAMVPDRPQSADRRAPLLRGATVRVDARAMRPFVERIRERAAASGSPAFAPLATRRFDVSEAQALFAAALNFDEPALGLLAQRAGLDVPALHALAALVPMPFLHACARAWDPRLRDSWSEGYCGVCGSWPAFVEVRGVERTRFLRCGRCGSGWQLPCLCCAYCGETDHERLGTLVIEGARAAEPSIEICHACRGYLKSFKSLAGAAPASVMLDDLASAVVDVVACERDWKRPAGLGCEIAVDVVAQRSPEGV